MARNKAPNNNTKTNQDSQGAQRRMKPFFPPVLDDEWTSRNIPRPNSPSSCALLLIEAESASSINTVMQSAPNTGLAITRESHIRDAVRRLGKDTFDAVIFDLSLPGSPGLSSLDSIVSASPGTPVIVLGDYDDEATILEAFEHGAQEFIVKDEPDFSSLRRTIRQAIHRKQREQQMVRFARDDDLTGLPNRMLFREELQKSIFAAHRKSGKLSVLFVDLR